MQDAVATAISSQGRFLSFGLVEYKNIFSEHSYKDLNSKGAILTVSFSDFDT